MFELGGGRRTVLGCILWMLDLRLEEADVGGVVRGSSAVACTDI